MPQSQNLFDTKLSYWTDSSELYVAALLLLHASLPKEQDLPEETAKDSMSVAFSEYAHKYWSRSVGRIYKRRPETKEISGILGYCLGLSDVADTSSFRHQTALDEKGALRRRWLVHDHEDMQPWDNPVFAACELGSLDLLDHLHRLGYDLTQANDGGRNLLLMAAWHGYDEICSFLIDHGAEINTLNHVMTYRRGSSALHAACLQGHLTTVKLLLSRGIDPNLNGEHTPLCRVIENYDYTEIFSTLLDWKADPNLPCQSGGFMCCLKSVFRYDADEALILFLKHGLDTTKWTDNNGTALDKAAYRGAAKCSRVLIEELGYDANSSDGGIYGSMLGAAACGGSVTMLQYLIEEVMVDPNILISSPPKPSAFRWPADTAWYFLKQQHLTQGGPPQDWHTSRSDTRSS